MFSKLEMTILVLIFIDRPLVDGYFSSYCKLTIHDYDPHDWQLLLPKGYSSTSPPAAKPDGQKPLNVYNSIELLDVDDVNEADATFSMQFFLQSVWSDDRLNTSAVFKTDPEKSVKKKLLLPPESHTCFWIPSIIFDNDKEEKNFELTFSNSKMSVYENGTVVRISRLSLKIKCQISLELYPMDRQLCHFRMRLMDEPKSTVNLLWTNETGSPINIEPLLYDHRAVNPTSYKMGAIAISTKEREWMFEKYTYLCIKFPFIRRITPSVVTIYIPSSLVVIVSWVTFWIDIEAPPARVTLGFMSILTIITQILEIRKLLPPVNYLTAIDIWLFVCLCFAFLSLAEYAFAYTLFRKIKKERAKKKDDEIRWAEVLPNPRNVLVALSRQASVNSTYEESNNDGNNNFLRVANGHATNAQNNLALNGTGLVSNHLQDMVSAIKKAIKPKRNQSIYDENSKMLFPLTFFTFAIGYWAYYQLTRYHQNSPDCDF